MTDSQMSHIPLRDIGVICVDDSMRWFPDHFNDLMHHSVALAGEVGEFCNIVKKLHRGSLPPLEIDQDNETRQMLLEELTDVMIYVGNIYGLLKGDPDACFQTKRWHNEQRFGQAQNGDNSDK